MFVKYKLSVAIINIFRVCGFVKNNNNNKNETLLMEMKQNCFCVNMMKDFFCFCFSTKGSFVFFAAGTPSQGSNYPKSTPGDI
jgi:hypothetical protein